MGTLGTSGERKLSQKERYQALKEAGICVRGNCGAPAEPGFVCCNKHRTESRDYQRVRMGYYKNEQKKLITAAQKEEIAAAKRAKAAEERERLRVRNLAIAKEVASRRWTLEEIGKRYGMTRERVRQLAVREGVLVRTTSKTFGRNCIVNWCAEKATRTLKTSLGEKAVCYTHVSWGEDVFLRERPRCHGCKAFRKRNKVRCRKCAEKASGATRYRRPGGYWRSWCASISFTLKDWRAFSGEYRAVYNGVATPWIRKKRAQALIDRFEKRFPGEKAQLEKLEEEEG